MSGSSDADGEDPTPGSGLGLAIVCQLATGDGGTVRVERAAAGGTRLVFHLPEEAV